jgi:hypothetical protein
MATSPLFMRDVSLTLGTGATEYNCQVASAMVEVTPGDEVTYTTLCSDGSFSEVGRSTYGLALRLGQDWANSQGLARYLWDNEGSVVTFRLQAHGSGTASSDSAPAMTGSVRIVAASYGGEVDTYAEAEVTLPCTAKPTLETATTP